MSSKRRQQSRRQQGRRKAEENHPPEARSDDASEPFGAWLRRQREGRGIELRQIADASKVSLRYYQAFEEDRFDALPALVFAKGFLRQYALYVGLDPEETVNFFLAARENQLEDEETDAPAPPRNGTPWGLIAALLAAGLLLIALVWGLSRLNVAGAEPAADAPPGNRGSANEIPTDQRRDLGDASATGVQTDLEPSAHAEPSPGSGSSVAADRSELDAVDPAVLVDAPRGRNPESNGEDASSVVDPGEGQGVVSDQAQSSALVVTLDFRGDCWIEALIDGQPRIAEMRVQGESLRLAGTDVIELKIGDFSTVDLEVNGRPFRFEPGRSAVRQVRIDHELATRLADGEPR